MAAKPRSDAAKPMEDLFQSAEAHWPLRAAASRLGLGLTAPLRRARTKYLTDHRPGTEAADVRNLAERGGRGSTIIVIEVQDVPMHNVSNAVCSKQPAPRFFGLNW